MPLIFDTVGFGYEPLRSPFAAPVGAAPEIAVFVTLVILPLLSTVKTGICVPEPYVFATTPVLERVKTPVPDNVESPDIVVKVGAPVAFAMIV